MLTDRDIANIAVAAVLGVLCLVMLGLGIAAAVAIVRSFFA